jgi:Putative auto-transporter adhesin, head GIN domain
MFNSSDTSPMKTRSPRGRVVAGAILTMGLLSSVLISGCSYIGVGTSGSGKAVTKQEAITGFNSVNASTAFQVNIVRSPSYSVTVEVNENLVDSLDVRKEGNTLILALKPGSYNNVTLKATVNMPDLQRLDLSGASNAGISGFKSSNPVEFHLTGASELNGTIDSGDILVDESGSSSANLAGKAGNLTVKCSGSSEAALSKLTVKNANVSLSGASDATVNVSGRLDGDLSGASTLNYTGNPTLGPIGTSGASSIHKQ